MDQIATPIPLPTLSLMRKRIMIKLSLSLANGGHPKVVRRGGVLNCHGGNLNYLGGNSNYHGGISSLLTQLPDPHPQGYPQRGGRAEAAPPWWRGGRRPPALWMGVWRLGRQGGNPTVAIEITIVVIQITTMAIQNTTMADLPRVTTSAAR